MNKALLVSSCGTCGSNLRVALTVGSDATAAGAGALAVGVGPGAPVLMNIRI